MDIKSKEKRSQNMSKIRSKNTKPEKFIRSLLFKHGLRFRVSFADINGKPDLYFSKKMVAVFVHGCFWHRHTLCKYAYTPKSNVEFWKNKFETNIKRDKTVVKQLTERNIRVLIIWECTVKRMMKDKAVESEIYNLIYGFLTTSELNYLEL